MVKPRIVLLIFVSGKVVLTGAKVRQQIYEAFDNIYPILKNFKKQWFDALITWMRPNVQMWLSSPLRTQTTTKIMCTFFLWIPGLCNTAVKTKNI